MKADVSQLNPPAKPVKVFEFTDSATPGWKAVLELRRFGVLSADLYEARGREKWHEHVVGRGPLGEDGKPDRKSDKFVPPLPVAPLGERPVVLTLGSCIIIAAIEIAQCQDDRYDFTELAKMCCSDDIAGQMVDAYNWVQPQGPEKAGDDGPPDSTGA